MAAYCTDFSCVDLKNDIPGNLKDAVVAIGNFDGVHRGHQAVLALTKDIAASENRPAIVMTFEPHPRSFFCPRYACIPAYFQTTKICVVAGTGP